MAKRSKSRKTKNQRVKRTASSTRQGNMLLLGLGLLVAVMLVGLGVLIYPALWNTPEASVAESVDTPAANTDTSVAIENSEVDSRGDKSQESTNSSSTNKADAGGAIGRVTDCQHNPNFSNKLGFESIAIDTSGSRGQGLALFDIRASDTFDPSNIYQDPSWQAVGDIGSYTIDQHGNLYVGPYPHIDLLKNPPASQNIVHRIDTETALMEPLVELPAVGAPSTHNPFGIVALTYDCETGSVYAASLAGSTRGEELGRISRIEPETGKVLAQLTGIDGYGLGIFRGSSGKRLYFGHARSALVRSIALDADGGFLGELRVEFSLEEFYGADALIARRISFREEQMKVDGFKFAFNLVPLADVGPRPSFRFDYEKQSDQWQFVEVSRDDF